MRLRLTKVQMRWTDVVEALNSMHRFRLRVIDASCSSGLNIF